MAQPSVAVMKYQRIRLPIQHSCRRLFEQALNRGLQSNEFVLLCQVQQI